jgi:hypothetical protein
MRYQDANPFSNATDTPLITTRVEIIRAQAQRCPSNSIITRGPDMQETRGMEIKVPVPMRLWPQGRAFACNVLHLLGGDLTLLRI